MRLFRKKKKKTTALSSPSSNGLKPVEKAETQESPSKPPPPAVKQLSTDTASTAPVLDLENSASTYTEFEDEETKELYADAKILREEYPIATFEECIRFRTIRTMKSARKNLDAYMEWRKTYRLDELISDAPTFENDSQIWDYAVKHSLSFFPNVKLEGKLPRYVRIIGDKPSRESFPVKKSEGKDSVNDKRTLYVLSGLIDPKVASLDIHALAFAMYFFLVAERNSLEYINVLIDNRSGEGWANCSASTLYPVAKKLNSHLSHFPQRLTKFFAYPVPFAAQVLWTFCKQFMKAVVVAKVNIHWGNDFDVVPEKWNFDQATLEKIDIERRSEL